MNEKRIESAEDEREVEPASMGARRALQLADEQAREAGEPTYEDALARELERAK